ncbi:hypothetical protein ACP70R_031505 [Stipagrostis hirtigluma subsp. patula]
MSGSEQSRSSSSYGDADAGTDTAPTTSGAVRWAPHGPALTACLVAVNVALVALVYLYFWRVFSRKSAASSSASAPGDGDDDDDASSSASTAPSPPRIRDEHARLVASLPTFVVGAGEKGAQQECAVCIAELRDGDEGRALPRCGHRFHAACVDAWLRRHTTCPLCRASVAVAAETGAGPKGGGVTGTTTAAEDMDSPV